MTTPSNNFDFLSFTFKIPYYLREKVDAALPIMSITLKDKMTCKPQNYKEGQRKLYENNFRFYIQTEGKEPFTFLINTKPLIKPNRFVERPINYMRLEFNPNKAGTELVKEIRKVLETLIGKREAKKIAINSKVTRVDMCIDIKKNINDLFPYYPQCKKMTTHRDKETKEITGFVLGSGKSKIMITIYNKNSELKEKGRPTMSGLLYRLEIRVRALGCNLLDLDPLDIRNKLSKIIFFNGGLFEEKEFTKEFKCHVQAYGINSAIVNLIENDRKKYLKILKEKYVEQNLFAINSINIDNFLDPIKPLY